MTNLSPHAAAILDELRTRRKTFTLGVSTGLRAVWLSDDDRMMQAAFVELTSAGLVVEEQQIDRVSRYDLVEEKTL